MTVTVRVPQGPGPSDSESELEVLKYYLPLARASVSRASQVTVSVPGNLKNVSVPGPGARNRAPARWSRSDGPRLPAGVCAQDPSVNQSMAGCLPRRGRRITVTVRGPPAPGPGPGRAHRKPAGPAAARPVGDSEAGTRPESEGPGHESQDHVRRVHCNLQCSLPKQLLILRVHPLLP
jgi:hypothetical protein